MIYSIASVRRKDRLLDEAPAMHLLKSGEYGVLSMSDSNGSPYGIPINYVWDGQNAIYIHCAKEGRKLTCIAHNNQVSFCVVGKTNILPEKFSTEYESIILECMTKTNLPENERMSALLMLVEKYSPEFKEKGQKYAEGSFHRTEVIRLDIKQWSGKSKKM